mmetsp:Transcript_11935/g.18422  ORF Transcript_11935/g.18422 Transcript_11935/m.18422 type:complete len:90 (-) Transcript_11935:421-690(-)
MNPDDIEEELRDVVFDYENSQALVVAADQFLKGDTSSFAGAVGGPDGGDDNASMNSRNSKGSKIQENIRNASKWNPYKVKTLDDKLNPK